MDKERLKMGHMFTDGYFERQLENIREIRRQNYEKIKEYVLEHTGLNQKVNKKSRNKWKREKDYSKM